MSAKIIKEKSIKAGIIGGAGYTGGELLRLLVHHPYATVSYVHSRSQAGKNVELAHPDLIGETDLLLSEDTGPLNDGSLDVLFLCVGHGEAKKFLQANEVADRTKIIDLSQDFRLTAHSTFEGRKFVYGLPELNKKQIKEANNIANPGCFATAIQLGLLPLASAGLLDEIYTTGITGSTGAGQGLSPTSHFSWRANNIQAYKTLSHQHIKEIHQSLNQLQKDFPEATSDDNKLSFVPWRGDFARGIFISSTITCIKKLPDLLLLYKEFYEDQPFTFVSENEIYLKQVVN
ncbi:MAG: N-acetyl-gamma-glutamyl-phosphate reductase, partial [Flavisolibacter sp.]